LGDKGDKMIFKMIGAAGLGLVGIIFFFAVIVAISALWWGFILMLVLGAVHHSLDHSISAWGYGTCFLLGIPMSFVLG
jgi:hypothetical protein